MKEKKITIKIPKDELPKARHMWKRKPETRVAESHKAYNRQRAKSVARKAVKNGN